MTFWTKKPEPLVDEKPAANPAPVAKNSAPAASASAPVQQAAAAPEQRATGLSIEDSLAARFGKVRSALGPGTVIQGKLSFDTPVRMDGKLSGEVYSSRALIVGESGDVEAELDVAALVVLGAVKGNVKAAERIEILPGGSIDGDVTAPVLIIEEGGRFNGSCKTTGQKASITGLDKRGAQPQAQPEKKKEEPARTSNGVRPEARL